MAGMDRFDPKERRRRRRLLAEERDKKKKKRNPLHNYGDDDWDYQKYLKGKYDDDEV